MSDESRRQNIGQFQDHLVAGISIPESERKMHSILTQLRRPVQAAPDQSAAPGRTDGNPAPVRPRGSCPEGFEGLESIDYAVRSEDRIAGAGENHDFGAEKFRFLCYRLKQLRQKRPLRSVLVTSAVSKEGKTVVATNLALSLARSSKRVALIDADLRQPGVKGVLGLSSLPGLAEYLEGERELTASVRRLNPFGIYFLPAGKASSNPYELLQGPRMQELLKLMVPAFEWIVIDSPPLVPFADAHCLASVADAALLVLRPGVSPRESVQQGLAALNGAHIAGVVLNASDDSRQDQYYYRYYPSSASSKP